MGAMTPDVTFNQPEWRGRKLAPNGAVLGRHQDRDFRMAAQLQVTVDHDEVCVGERFHVSFHHTLRIPEDTESSKALAGLTTTISGVTAGFLAGDATS